MDLLSAMSYFEMELTARQLKRIAARRAAIGAAGIRKIEEEWRALAALMRVEMEAGSSPASARVQEVAGRARRHLEAFTGGDPAVYRALDRLRRELPPEGLAGWDSDRLSYLYQALATDGRTREKSEALPPGSQQPLLGESET